MSDHLFPRYHVRPPKGFVNDPNGPIVVGGLVHLYHQHRETVDLASPVRWAHVTSTDLAHWDHHPPALTPHPRLGDRDGCWSGNTVVDDAGQVRAFYSGRVDGEPLQRTLEAVSTDGGYSFGPPREVVAAPPADDGVVELRDPFVWRRGAAWWMALGAGTAETAMVRLYTSDDLSAWVYVGPLARMARTRTAHWDSGAMWECPQVLTFGDVTVALVSTCADADGAMDVLSVAVPHEGASPRVQPGALHRVDHGPDFYAASVLQDGPDGAVVWGWAREGRTAQWCAEDGWSGMLTLPRVATLRPDGGLSCTPAPGLRSLRRDPASRSAPEGAHEVGAQFEFLLQAPDEDRGPCSLRLRCGPNEHLDVTVDAGAGRVSVDRRHASIDPRADRDTVTLEGVAGLASPTPGVRGFVDGSILELFLPDGRVATTRFYPTNPPPWQLEVARGAGHLSVWELDAAQGSAAP